MKEWSGGCKLNRKLEKRKSKKPSGSRGAVKDRLRGQGVEKEGIDLLRHLPAVVYLEVTAGVLEMN